MGRDCAQGVQTCLAIAVLLVCPSGIADVHKGCGFSPLLGCHMQSCEAAACVDESDHHPVSHHGGGSPGHGRVPEVDQIYSRLCGRGATTG